MDRREQMRALLARRERDGLTFAALSRESGVPQGTLAFWAWKLRQESAPIVRSRFAQPSFVEVVATQFSSAAPRMPSRIEIVLAGDRRVIVDAGMDDELLARVIRTLERC